MMSIANPRLEHFETRNAFEILRNSNFRVPIKINESSKQSDSLPQEASGVPYNRWNLRGFLGRMATGTKEEISLERLDSIATYQSIHSNLHDFGIHLNASGLIDLAIGISKHIDWTEFFSGENEYVSQAGRNLAFLEVLKVTVFYLLVRTGYYHKIESYAIRWHLQCGESIWQSSKSLAHARGESAGRIDEALADAYAYRSLLKSTRDQTGCTSKAVLEAAKEFFEDLHARTYCEFKHPKNLLDDASFHEAERELRLSIRTCGSQNALTQTDEKALNLWNPLFPEELNKTILIRENERRFLPISHPPFFFESNWAFLLQNPNWRIADSGGLEEMGWSGKDGKLSKGENQLFLKSKGFNGWKTLKLIYQFEPGLLSFDSRIPSEIK